MKLNYPQTYVTKYCLIYRNYLAGCIAINSLFGPAELDRVLPTREVKIFVGTWNMNEHNPPK